MTKLFGMQGRHHHVRCIAGLFIVLVVSRFANAQEIIPHGQSKLPGEPVSAAEAVKRMTVPPGFHVEVVACEPEIINPIAMAFDERGRIWITESLEYPRSSAGPGRDRIKILEDTDQDGRADKFTIFADGLNIPSGLAIGYGGVWVANAPDLLFMQDTDGDDRADKVEVVVTGFGRDDTHELPNSLTWGPDGYLYGLNGVFNNSRIKQGEREFNFTCALFRVDPRTRRFELFAEGTSNPWGVAFDSLGSAFVSACVIDHLWHLAESGYYIRQGGPYPPQTWPMGSIVEHHHQQAAYCGLNYFDSDAYPEDYRQRLYMGNIHGNCINVDRLERRGSTYLGSGEADFLSANDAWFMPVAQKTGPDGCLYILDWYDRYHCYQDARRDPEGIDRLKGRLYRVCYKSSPMAPKMDLLSESDDQLLQRLQSPNVFLRETAQRILGERSNKESAARLEALVTDSHLATKYRLHALWALASMETIDINFFESLLNNREPMVVAWAVRVLADKRVNHQAFIDKLKDLSRTSNRDVLLQVATAATKVDVSQALPLLLGALDHAGDDRLIPHIVWQNLHPIMDTQAVALIDLIGNDSFANSANVKGLLPRIVDRLLSGEQIEIAATTRLLSAMDLNDGEQQSIARNILEVITERLISGEIQIDKRELLKQMLQPVVDAIKTKIPSSTDLFLHSQIVSAALHEEADANEIQKAVRANLGSDAARLLAFRTLISIEQAETLALAKEVLAQKTDASRPFRRQVIAALTDLDRAETAELLIDEFPACDLELRPQLLEVLTSRAPWSRQLMRALDQKLISADSLNINQIRRLANFADPELKKQVQSRWGTIRMQRNPERENYIDDVRQKLRVASGDPLNGERVFEKSCGQCHKIYGKGFEIGPDLTETGRGSFEQLLSNVFDPSLVIGSSYQAQTVQTVDGVVVTGLLVEDSPQRVILKGQGGKLTAIPRADVEEVAVSKLSLMPEDFEKQYQGNELVDLFAFLTLDKHPSDPTAKKIPGSSPSDSTEAVPKN